MGEKMKNGLAITTNCREIKIKKYRNRNHVGIPIGNKKSSRIAAFLLCGDLIRRFVAICQRHGLFLPFFKATLLKYENIRLVIE